MSLKEIREGELNEVFSAIEEAFKATGTDFYIIGAVARDIWYAKAEKPFRRTKDVDFAVLVGSNEEYGTGNRYNTCFCPLKSNQRSQPYHVIPPFPQQYNGNFSVL